MLADQPSQTAIHAPAKEYPAPVGPVYYLRPRRTKLPPMPKLLPEYDGPPRDEKRGPRKPLADRFAARLRKSYRQKALAEI